jgi:hypothetical protein
LEAPRAYARLEVEEYDRQMEMAAAARGTGSSSGARSSAIARAPLPPPKREEEDQQGAGRSAIAREPLPPPKREKEEQQGAAPRAGRGYLPGDFVDDVDLDWVTAELMERTKDEPQQLEADREMKRKLYEYQYRQAIEESKANIPWGSSDFDSNFDSGSDSG